MHQVHRGGSRGGRHNVAPPPFEQPQSEKKRPPLEQRPFGWTLRGVSRGQWGPHCLQRLRSTPLRGLPMDLPTVPRGSLLGGRCSACRRKVQGLANYRLLPSDCLRRPLTGGGRRGRTRHPAASFPVPRSPRLPWQAGAAAGGGQGRDAGGSALAGAGLLLERRRRGDRSRSGARRREKQGFSTRRPTACLDAALPRIL